MVASAKANLPMKSRRVLLVTNRVTVTWSNPVPPHLLAKS